jgi:hypothetical protein
MPRCLLELCAHVAGYEPVLERWRTGDFEPLDKEDNMSVVDYPAAALRQYVSVAYTDLKREQIRLLKARGLESNDRLGEVPSRSSSAV